MKGSIIDLFPDVSLLARTQSEREDSEGSGITFGMDGRISHSRRTGATEPARPRVKVISCSSEEDDVSTNNL